jgi:hypothetical protein
MIDKIYKDSSAVKLSTYQPSEEVKQITKKVKKDYQIGSDILNRTWVELNHRSVVEDENRGQLMFNAFVDTSEVDSHEAWKWRGTRSMARNKGIAMHAQLTANYLLPVFIAQNENDETDQDFSEVMRDIIEWMTSPTNSNYQSSFLEIVFGMIKNPVTYLGAEWCEVMQTIREKQEDGSYTMKEILDEVLSGFKAEIWSSTQVLITNAYERNIQRQRAIIKRRYVEKDELEAKYGDHPHWGFVQEGIKSIYNDQDGLFYDIKDDEHLTVVAEEIHMSRQNDCEIPFVNGIYLGNLDVSNNPVKHRDNQNRPKYNVVPFGYRRIGEHFFYYKSMMSELGWDNALYDAMSEAVMNRAFLEVDMPIAISGVDNIDSEVIFPSSVVSLENKDAKVQQLLPNSNMVAGFNALRETEKSMNEGSNINETLAGQLPDASQKAFSVAQAQANAKKLLGAVGKSLAESIAQYGDLMKDIAINHLTLPQVDELTSGALKLKYRAFLIPEKSKNGKSVEKKIRFDSKLIGKQMSKEEMDYANVALLDEVGYPNNKQTLVVVNPIMFSKFKYLTRVDVQEMFTQGNEYWQNTLVNLKGALANDPYVDQQALTKRLLTSYFNSDADDLMKDESDVIPLPPEDMNTKSIKTTSGVMPNVV